MILRDVTCLQDARAVLGEGPVWDDATQMLWWVDIKSQLLRRADAAGQATGQWTLPGQIGCLGLRNNGGLVLALEQGLMGFDPDTGTLTAFGDLVPQAGALRFNDGKVGPGGRFWVGSIDDRTYPAIGRLHSVGPDGVATQRLDGLMCANGIGWTQDGRRMFYTDSMRRVIWAFEHDPETGNLSHQSVFAEVAGPAVPDGLAVDVEGCVWSALWDGGAVVRLDPRGHEIGRLKLPVPRPTSCAFGGPQLTRLYITSASAGLSPDDLARAPLSGGLFAIDLDVAGVPVGSTTG